MPIAPTLRRAAAGCSVTFAVLAALLFRACAQDREEQAIALEQMRAFSMGLHAGQTVADVERDIRRFDKLRVSTFAPDPRALTVYGAQAIDPGRSLIAFLYFLKNDGEISKASFGIVDYTPAGVVPQRCFLTREECGWTDGEVLHGSNPAPTETP